MVATIPATIAEMKYSKQGFRLRNWRSPDARRMTYLEYILANDKHAKEMKLFGFGPLFLRRYKDLAERFHREDSRLMVRRTIVTYALSLLATLAFYGAYSLRSLWEETIRVGLTQPGFDNFIVIATGWILTQGMHAVTKALVMTDGASPFCGSTISP